MHHQCIFDLHADVLALLLHIHVAAAPRFHMNLVPNSSWCWSPRSLVLATAPHEICSYPSAPHDMVPNSSWYLVSTQTRPSSRSFIHPHNSIIIFVYEMYTHTRMTFTQWSPHLTTNIVDVPSLWCGYAHTDAELSWWDIMVWVIICA